MSQSIVAALSSLSLQEGEPTVVSHSSAPTPAEWSAALKETSGVPASFELLKTLVFKPKTAKSDTPVPVVVVTNDATQTNTAALGAHLKLKELRMAVPELLQATLHATKDDVSPFSVTSENAKKVRVVVDQAILESGGVYAVRARSSSETVFVSGATIVSYLTSTGVQLDTVDLSTLVAPSVSAPAAKPAPKAKADAKIPEAELIGITVRKDLDFPEWYQQVLRKGDMLDYYDVSGCYILKPWSYFVWEQIQGSCAINPSVLRR